MCINSNSHEIELLKKAEFQLKVLLSELNDHEKIDLMKSINHEEEINNASLVDRIENLKKTKNDCLFKRTSEADYTNSLGHMIEMEKSNLHRQNRQRVEINDFLFKIQLSYKSIDTNYSVRNLKSRNMDCFQITLKKEVTKMNNLVLTQNNKSEDLLQSLQKHNTQIVLSKENLKKKNTVLEKYVKVQKETIKKNIHSVEQIKRSKTFKEKEAVRLILGLDIIKR